MITYCEHPFCNHGSLQQFLFPHNMYVIKYNNIVLTLCRLRNIAVNYYFILLLSSVGPGRCGGADSAEADANSGDRAERVHASPRQRSAGPVAAVYSRHGVRLPLPRLVPLLWLPSPHPNAAVNRTVACRQGDYHWFSSMLLINTHSLTLHELNQ